MTAASLDLKGLQRLYVLQREQKYLKIECGIRAIKGAI
jgi:hypothetical protein